MTKIIKTIQNLMKKVNLQYHQKSFMDSIYRSKMFQKRLSRKLKFIKIKNLIKRIHLLLLWRQILLVCHHPTSWSHRSFSSLILQAGRALSLQRIKRMETISDHFDRRVNIKLLQSTLYNCISHCLLKPVSHQNKLQI